MTKQDIAYLLGGGVLFYLIYKMLTKTRIRIAAQNSFYTQTGAKGGVIVLSGSWFSGIGAPGVTDFRSFVTRTPAEVEARLGTFLRGHLGVNPQMTGILVIDIEDPRLTDMHQRPDIEQGALIAAVRIRIDAAHKLFPKAKLALYGMVNPDGRGRSDDPEYASRLASFIRAGKVGMFDGLDYLAPVLYLRFGPMDKDWGTLAAYTRLGIEGSKMLKKSSGAAIPILPLTSLWVANGNSKHNGQIILDLPTPDPVKDTLGQQFGVFKTLGVKDGVVWTGEDSDLILHEPNPRGLTVSQHVTRMIG